MNTTKKRRWLKIGFWFASLVVAAGLGAYLALSLASFPISDLTNVYYRYSEGESDGLPVVRIFFATNRKVLSAEEGTFADEGGGQLTYGSALVRIPPKLRIGDLQMPEIPRKKPDESRPTVLRVDIVPEKEFFQLLNAQIKERDAKSVNLLVHGVNHTFDSSVRQAAALGFALNLPQPMVLFAWPTEAGVLPANYQRDTANVGGAAKALTEFLEVFQPTVAPQKINLISHSLGGRVVCESFDELFKNSAWNDKEHEMANVVFAAPDVNLGDFNQRFIKEVADLAARVTVYVARNDGVLVLSSILNHEQRAGKWEEVKNGKAHVVSSLISRGGTDLQHVEVVDATFVNNVRTEHSYFYQCRPVFSDLHILLRHDRPASERHLLRYEGEEKGNYWITPP